MWFALRNGLAGVSANCSGAFIGILYLGRFLSGIYRLFFRSGLALSRRAKGNCDKAS
jgi:hypothetical protein